MKFTRLFIIWYIYVYIYMYVFTGAKGRRGVRASTEVVIANVSCHLGQSDPYTVDILGHLDLAAEPTGLCEAVGQVQHVVLIVFRFRQGVVVVWVDDDMAGGASARATARTFHVQVVTLGYVQDGLALADLIRLLGAVL